MQVFREWCMISREQDSDRCETELPPPVKPIKMSEKKVFSTSDHTSRTLIALHVKLPWVNPSASLTVAVFVSLDCGSVIVTRKKTTMACPIGADIGSREWRFCIRETAPS
jgi:hypothetical protein